MNKPNTLLYMLFTAVAMIMMAGIVFSCGLLTFSTVSSAVNAALQEVGETQGVVELCTGNLESQDLQVIYNTHFTQSYREKTSFADFVLMYEAYEEEVFSDCDGYLTNVKVWNLLLSEDGYTVETSNENKIELEYETDSKQIKLHILKENSQWLVDDLAIEE